MHAAKFITAIKCFDIMNEKIIVRRNVSLGTMMHS